MTENNIVNVLQMTFANHNGKKKTLRLSHPKPNLTAADVQDVMQMIVDGGFYPLDATKVVSAKVVQTTTQNLDVVDA